MGASLRRPAPPCHARSAGQVPARLAVAYLDRAPECGLGLPPTATRRGGRLTTAATAGIDPKQRAPGCPRGNSRVQPIADLRGLPPSGTLAPKPTISGTAPEPRGSARLQQAAGMTSVRAPESTKTSHKSLCSTFVGRYITVIPHHQREATDGRLQNKIRDDRGAFGSATWVLFFAGKSN